LELGKNQYYISISEKFSDILILCYIYSVNSKKEFDLSPILLALEFKSGKSALRLVDFLCQYWFSQACKLNQKILGKYPNKNLEKVCSIGDISKMGAVGTFVQLRLCHV